MISLNGLHSSRLVKHTCLPINTSMPDAPRCSLTPRRAAHRHLSCASRARKSSLRYLSIDRYHHRQYSSRLPQRGPGGGRTGEWFDDKGRMDVHDLMDEIRNYQLEYELWLANADVRDESALRRFLFQELS